MAKHKQEFFTYNSGTIRSGCKCGWWGNSKGHSLKENAIAEYNAHKKGNA